MSRTPLAGKPLVVIVGATATGKTALAIALAQAITGEIVSADSRQIYREMDIGTAKPTPAQQQHVPHHLIDVVAPDEDLGLATYQQQAYAAIDAIHQRGQVPLLVGGTGQYVTAVVEGWSIPEVPPNAALRAELEAFAEEHGAERLHQRLQALDPVAAARTDYRNVRRVARALEVCLETGQRISSLQQKYPPPYTMRHLGLTGERSTLYARADQRVDEMMTAGFVEEVNELLKRGYDPRLPSMSGLGYSQLASHLQHGTPVEQAILETKHATHDFIRRQLTWFRGHDPGIMWHNIEMLDRSALLADTLRWLQDL